jgi:hypothetical protein
MKTPREIFIEQHQSADSRLENIQRTVIATSLNNEATSLQGDAQRFGLRQSSAAFPFLAHRLWSELILPARRLWLSYAFIWIAIAIFYIANADHTIAHAAKIANPSDAIANWKEQQTILAELTKPASHEPVDRPKPQLMRPRSEAQTIATG